MNKKYIVKYWDLQAVPMYVQEMECSTREEAEAVQFSLQGDGYETEIEEIRL